MKPMLLILSAVAILAAAVSASSRLPGGSASAVAVAKPCSPVLRLPRATPAGEISLYGRIESVKRHGRSFELRFDPALLLSGVTASRAALADTGSSEVANDTYTLDESHRLLTFRVPATASVTVLERSTCTTRTTVARLARSIPAAAFWIRVRIDTVRSLDQQYHP